MMRGQQPLAITCANQEKGELMGDEKPEGKAAWADIACAKF